MSYPQRQEITLFDNVTPVTVTSSTDATPIVVTATAHGFTTGQRVFIFGHTTNVATNGIYLVTRLSANTFSLQDEITGINVAGSGAGAGSGGLCCVAPPLLRVSDFRNIIIQVGTSGTATMTLKAIGSQGMPPSVAIRPRGAYPNIGGTISANNPYSFLNLINLDSGASLAGSTGIALSGADVNNEWEVNTNALLFFTVIPTAWSAGVLTIRALCVSNA